MWTALWAAADMPMRCKRLGSGKLIGIDQDADANEAAGKRLRCSVDKVTIVRSNYANIKGSTEGVGN